MFRPQGLFTALRCPDTNSCQRNPCPFSHKAVHELPKRINITDALLPMPKNKPKQAPTNSTPSARTSGVTSTKLDLAASSLKRHATPSSSQSSTPATTTEPLRKIQKVVPTTTTGAPRIQVNPSLSKVAISDRQKLLSAMYDQFRTLYTSLLVLDPTLSARHALAQEQEVYEKATRTTYRNAMISAMASIKKRPAPDKLSHPSVGTIGELAERTAKASSLSNFKLLPAQLEPLLLTKEDMVMWDYVVEVPLGPGGDRPNENGNAMKCDRCNSQYIVAKDPALDECVYHWGRAYGTKVNGVRETIHRCCSMPSGSPGCQKGPHVFSEKLVTSLHARHPFSMTASVLVTGSNTLDICAIDCEMVYTTAGMSVARVSGVDNRGNEAFDHFVRMNEDVDVVDFNTRFSGITSLDDAMMDLARLKEVLGRFIGPDTIIVGHALENDLKTLRMVHNRVVDTSTLYQHKAGAPYRRSLRELAREYLGASIQNGDGTTGHSSLEDARATLDLVKFWVRERPELLKRGSTVSSA